MDLLNMIPVVLQNVYWKIRDNNTVIVYLPTQQGKALTLRSAAAEIFKMCCKGLTIDEIYNGIAEKSSAIDKKQICDDTVKFIQQLYNAEIIDFKGVRREIEREKFRILLINPSSFNNEKRLLWDQTPMGLLSLAMYMKEKGFSVQILNMTQENEPNPMIKLITVLKEYNPHVIGITSLSSNFDQGDIIGRIAKSMAPKAILINGGMHVTILKDQILEDNKYIDMVIVGEGEETLYEVCEHLRKNVPLNDAIKGIIFRDKNNIVATQPREPIQDLDSLPFPSKYLEYQPELKFEATMHTSRGCPFKCRFCSSRVMWGSKYRIRTVKSVIAEIEYMQDKLKIDRLYISDDLFLLDKKRNKLFCAMLMNKGIKISWHTSARVDTMDLETLNIMAKAGCERLMVGIETTTPKALELANKGYSTFEEIKNGIDLCKKAGIETRGQYILGLPGETKESMLKMIEDAKILDCDENYFSFLQLYPGCEFAAKRDEYHIKTPMGKDIDMFEPVLETDGYTYRDIIDVYLVAMDSFNLNLSNKY